MPTVSDDDINSQDFQIIFDVSSTAVCVGVF